MDLDATNTTKSMADAMHWPPTRGCRGRSAKRRRSPHGWRDPLHKWGGSPAASRLASTTRAKPQSKRRQQHWKLDRSLNGGSPRISKNSSLKAEETMPSLHEGEATTADTRRISSQHSKKSWRESLLAPFIHRGSSSSDGVEVSLTHIAPRLICLSVQCCGRSPRPSWSQWPLPRAPS